MVREGKGGTGMNDGKTTDTDMGGMILIEWSTFPCSSYQVMKQKKFFEKKKGEEEERKRDKRKWENKSFHSIVLERL